MAHTHRFCATWIVWAGALDHPVAIAARQLAHRAVVTLIYQIDYPTWEIHHAVKTMLQRADKKAGTAHAAYLDPTCRICTVDENRRIEQAQQAALERAERIDVLLAK
jgi:hypothetical protein